MLKQMYRAKLNSPETNIIGGISAIETQFGVVDIGAVTPDDGIFPILLMIGGNRSDCETVRLLSISGNTLTVERGFESAARSWEADPSGEGVLIAANFGAQHHNTFVENIKTLEGMAASGGVELSDADEPAAGIKTHYRVMHDIEGFLPFTPPNPEEPDGTAGLSLATHTIEAFDGAKLAELRIYGPNGNFNSVLPTTVLQGVKDPENNRNLLNILTEHYAAIFGHILNTDIHVTADYINNLNQIVTELVAFTQKEDIFLTSEQKTLWNIMSQTAADALALAQEATGKLVDHEARILQLEDAIFNQIHTNPFLITFGNLEGVIIEKGIHNPVYRRIEF